MTETMGNFLNWMQELTKINNGRNFVAFRETTPQHFDSPDFDGKGYIYIHTYIYIYMYEYIYIYIYIYINIRKYMYA
jgi:hypothetical protein